MINKCIHLEELLESEVSVIKQNIEEWKEFKHIKNDEKAYRSYIKNYGEWMREQYCGLICKDRHDCKLAKKYLTD